MEEKKLGLPAGYIWLLCSLVIIAAVVGVYVYRNNQVVRNFHHQEYEDLPSGRDQGKFRRYLEDLGVYMAPPATEGQTLTFTSPMTFQVQERFSKKSKVRIGTELSCDFVTWSENGSSRRSLQLTWDGKTKDVTVSPKEAAKLYVAALKQNGLEAQFQTETGERLNYSSAREALRNVDRQIYNMGMYMPGDYPYDRSFFKSLTMLLGGSAPLALIVLIMLGGELGEYLRYRAWLTDYNRENSQRWRQVEGNLPQFVSLANNSDGGKPKLVYRPDTIHRLKKLFSTPAKR